MNTFSHLTFVIYFGSENFRCWKPICIWTCFTLRWKPDIFPMILLRRQSASGQTGSFMPASWYQWVEIKRFRGICMLLPTQTTGRQHSKEPASRSQQGKLSDQKKKGEEQKRWYDRPRFSQERIFLACTMSWKNNFTAIVEISCFKVKWQWKKKHPDN